MRTLRLICVAAIGCFLAVAVGVGSALTPSRGKPVLKPKKSRRLHLMLVLDRSGSMTGAKMTMLKKAGEKIIRKLKRRDKIGIIAFDALPVTVFGLAPVRSGRAARKALGSIKAQGGTAVEPALRKAYAMMGPRPKRRRVTRHVLLVSDGYSPYGKVLAIEANAASAGVTTSTIALGSGADRKFLGSIAANGKGHSYRVVLPRDLPVACLRELKRMGR